MKKEKMRIYVFLTINYQESVFHKSVGIRYYNSFNECNQFVKCLVLNPKLLR